jgi:hypothetical protein
MAFYRVQISWTEFTFAPKPLTVLEYVYYKTQLALNPKYQLPRLGLKDFLRKFYLYVLFPVLLISIIVWLSYEFEAATDFGVAILLGGIFGVIGGLATCFNYFLYMKEHNKHLLDLRDYIIRSSDYDEFKTIQHTTDQDKIFRNLDELNKFSEQKRRLIAAILLLIAFALIFYFS